MLAAGLVLYIILCPSFSPLFQEHYKAFWFSVRLSECIVMCLFLNMNQASLLLLTAKISVPTVRIILFLLQASVSFYGLYKVGRISTLSLKFDLLVKF